VHSHVQTALSWSNHPRQERGHTRKRKGRASGISATANASIPRFCEAAFRERPRRSTRPDAKISLRRANRPPRPKSSTRAKTGNCPDIHEGNKPISSGGDLKTRVQEKREHPKSFPGRRQCDRINQDKRDAGSSNARSRARSLTRGLSFVSFLRLLAEITRFNQISRNEDSYSVCRAQAATIPGIARPNAESRPARPSGRALPNQKGRRNRAAGPAPHRGWLSPRAIRALARDPSDQSSRLRNLDYAYRAPARSLHQSRQLKTRNQQRVREPENQIMRFLPRLTQLAAWGRRPNAIRRNRARALGWLPATTNLGVALGPVLGFRRPLVRQAPT